MGKGQEEGTYGSANGYICTKVKCEVLGTACGIPRNIEGAHQPRDPITVSMVLLLKVPISFQLYGSKQREARLETISM